MGFMFQNVILLKCHLYTKNNIYWLKLHIIFYLVPDAEASTFQLLQPGPV